MPYASMEFYFTAKESNDTQKHNTRLVITKSEHGGYDWRMVTYYENLRDIVYLHMYTVDEVVKRIEPMLVMFKADGDPFESLEIRLPGFPPMKVHPSAYHYVFHAITDAVNDVVEHWPTSIDDSRNIIDEEDEDEGEYDDMPPLIPINEVESYCPPSPIHVPTTNLECESRPEFCEPTSPPHKRAKISHHD